ncbi:MAG: CDP-diacylglycerol--glycerol-3-phosphate 3-phosphatidyltransferase [Treponema sp.]|jgi:CDP-diacylglycerol--glycerol-3-phosphate 3-phosphatidyltransferase|nr:CDP-diacylglycerol--glycerol-3-phosphate 3-phosphatidyltransferase [Treponema sp.]
MTPADKVTTLRIILAPVFFLLYNLHKLIPPLFSSPSAALWLVPALWVIFIGAELTDMWDGMIARRRGEVSDFGKLYDPFADTIMQISLFFCFVWDNLLPVIPFLLILYREFGILFVRNLMLRRGISLGARMGGKIKTVTYIAAGALALAASSLQRLSGAVDSWVPWYTRFYLPCARAAVIVFIIAVILALASFGDYVKVYRAAVKGKPAE